MPPIEQNHFVIRIQTTWKGERSAIDKVKWDIGKIIPDSKLFRH